MPATPQNVALQAADLPNGMTRCGMSGDIDRFLTQAPPGNQYAANMAELWLGVRKLGAQGGYVQVFAGSNDQCVTPFTSASLTGVRWIANMVVEFKTDKAAGKAYRDASAGAQQIASQPGSEQGSGTGLGNDSLTFGNSEGDLSEFFAYWHHGKFLVQLLAVGLGEQRSHQAARKVDGRIH